MTPWARLGAAAARLDHRAQRWMRAGSRALGAAVVESLSLEELAALGVSAYDRPTHNAGLFDWEATWCDRWLKPGDAVLLGGAGAGREAIALQRMSVHVHAYEPNAAQARKCARAISAPVATLRHEDLAEGVHALFRRRYDAVMFGWGSLTHVLDPAQRRAAIRAACALTEGPVLASFWLAEDGARRRGQQAGARLGRLVGRLRGLDPPPPEVRYQVGAGVGAALTRAEVASWVPERRVEWGEGVYPHVTLLP